MVENNSVFNNEVPVKILFNWIDWFFTMVVAIIHHTINKQYGVVAVAWATSVTLVGEVASKINWPTIWVKLQPPQVIVMIGVKIDMTALYTFFAQSVNKNWCVSAFIFIALYELFQVLQRCVKDARKSNWAAVIRAQLVIVSNVFAVS